MELLPPVRYQYSEFIFGVLIEIRHGSYDRVEVEPRIDVVVARSSMKRLYDEYFLHRFMVAAEKPILSFLTPMPEHLTLGTRYLRRHLRQLCHNLGLVSISYQEH